LAKLLKKNATLTTLNLNHNKIDEKGAARIIEALKYNSIITSINLHENGITALREKVEELLEINHQIETKKNSKKIKLEEGFKFKL